MNQKQMAKMGGLATREIYGSEFYSKIGKKGALANMAKHGQEYFKTLSKQGVEARKKKALDKATGSVV